MLSFVPSWDTIYHYLSAWEFMVCFSKYLQRVKNTHKPTKWYDYKKINNKILTDQLSCSYFTLFHSNQSWIVKNVAISKGVSLGLTEFRLFLWNRQEIDKNLTNCKKGGSDTCKPIQ